MCSIGLLNEDMHYCVKQKVVSSKMSVTAKICAYLIQKYLN